MFDFYCVISGSPVGRSSVRLCSSDVEVIEIGSSDDEALEDGGVLDMVVVDAAVAKHLGIAATATKCGSVDTGVVRSTQKRGVPWDNSAVISPKKHRKGVCLCWLLFGWTRLCLLWFMGVRFIVFVGLVCDSCGVFV